MKYLISKIKWGVAVVLVWLLVITIDWSAVKSVIQNLSISIFFLYIAFFLLGTIVSAYKWQVIASWTGYGKDNRYFWKLYMAGMFVNNFFPGFIGGDAFRAYRLDQDHKGIEKSTLSRAVATTIADRLSGLIAVLFLVLLGIVLNIPSIVNDPLLFSSAAVVVFLLIGYVVFLILKRKLIAFFAKKEGKIARLARAVFVYTIPQWRVMIVLGIVFNIVGVGITNYLLFAALGSTPPVIPFFGVIFLSSLVSSIPISINNIGVKEWVYLVLFPLIGVSQPLSATAALLSRFVQMIVSLAGLPTIVRYGKPTGNERW